MYMGNNKKNMIKLIKQIYHFIFHFNPAQDIEWDGRRYKENCHTCDGTGYVEFRDFIETCPTCEGTGEYTKSNK